METTNLTIQKVRFLYRDASNYKFSFSAAIKTDTLFEVDDEIEYEDIGFTQDTFHKKVVKYKYNHEDDHNFITVTDLLDENAEVDFTDLEYTKD